MNLNRKFQYIDLKELIELVGGDEDTIAVLIDEFFDSAPSDIKNLEESINSGIYHKIAEDAHKLKATFRYFGIVGTEEIVQIEFGAKNQLDLSQLKEKFLIANNGFFNAIEEIKLIK